MPVTDLYKNDIKKIQKKEVNVRLRNVSRTIGVWDHDTIRNAITDQVTGDFEATARLARKMMQDAAYSAAINKRTWALTRSDFSLIPVADSKKAHRIADTIEKIYKYSVPEATIERLLQSYHNLGIAVGYIEWSQINKIWTPNIKIVNMEDVFWDQSVQKLIYNAQNGQFEIEPGDGNWIVLSRWEEGQVTGFISQLAECWINKKFCERDYNAGNLAQVEPLAVLSVEDHSAFSDQDDIDLIAEEIINKKRDRFVYAPPGYQLNYVDSLKNYKPDAYLNWIDYTDRKYQVSILGGNLSSEINNQGAYSAAQTHNSVELKYVQSDAVALENVLFKQLILYICQANLINLDFAPYPAWSLEEPEDVSKLADNLIKLKQLIPESEFKIKNIEEITEKFGVILEPREVQNNDQTPKETDKETPSPTQG